MAPIGLPCEDRDRTEQQPPRAEAGTSAPPSPPTAPAPRPQYTRPAPRFVVGRLVVVVRLVIVWRLVHRRRFVVG
eukprot:scaffold34726_cov56-Isochrysis_galbana.AAC.1